MSSNPNDKRYPRAWISAVRREIVFMDEDRKCFVLEGGAIQPERLGIDHENLRRWFKYYGASIDLHRDITEQEALRVQAQKCNRVEVNRAVLSLLGLAPKQFHLEERLALSVLEEKLSDKAVWPQDGSLRDYPFYPTLISRQPQEQEAIAQKCLALSFKIDRDFPRAKSCVEDIAAAMPAIYGLSQAAQMARLAAEEKTPVGMKLNNRLFIAAGSCVSAWQQAVRDGASDGELSRVFERTFDRFLDQRSGRFLSYIMKS